MSDPSSLRSKAEASYRLAEIAKTARAREIFRELGEEYEKRANGTLSTELMKQAETVPLAPLVSDASLAPAMPGAAQVAPADDTPLVPQTVATATPLGESDRFIADLKALREQTARDS